MIHLGSTRLGFNDRWYAPIILIFNDVKSELLMDYLESSYHQPFGHDEAAYLDRQAIR